MDNEVTEQAPVADAGGAMEKLMAPPTPPEKIEEKLPPPIEQKAEPPVPPEPSPQTEEKEEKVEDKKPVEDDSDIDEQELAKNASPKSVEALKIIKQKAKEARQEARKAREELAQITAARAEVDARIKKLEEQQVTPELQKELDDLRGFRQNIGIETDPEVTKPFDDRIASSLDNITGVLKQLAVPEPTLKYINDHGGLYAFRNSEQFMPSQIRNKDGSPMTHSQFYKLHIDPNLNVSQSEELNDSYAEIRRASREKAASIKSIAANKEQYVKSKQAAAQAAKDEWVKRADAHSAKVLESYGEDAKLKEIPPNASPEVQASIEKHNQTYRDAEARFRQILGNVTPENLVESAMAAGYVPVLQQRLKDSAAVNDSLRKERDDLQKKLDDLILAGKTSDLNGTTEAQKTTAPLRITGATASGDAMTEMVNQLK
jgi:hypothetical protein